MKKNKIKKEFLNKLEFFYRNLGSIWSVEDFTNNRDVQSLLKDYLLVLEEKGIVEIIEGNKFKITNLVFVLFPNIFFPKSLYYPNNICTFAMLEPAKPLNDAQMCGSFFNII
jgi:hypothetical protein